MLFKTQKTSVEIKGMPPAEGNQWCHCSLSLLFPSRTSGRWVRKWWSCQSWQPDKGAACPCPQSVLGITDVVLTPWTQTGTRDRQRDSTARHTTFVVPSQERRGGWELMSKTRKIKVVIHETTRWSCQRRAMPVCMWDQNLISNDFY